MTPSRDLPPATCLYDQVTDDTALVGTDSADGFAKPIGPIMPGGRLLNTLRHYVCNECPIALGFFPMGDSLCHTNPAYALGLTFSLIHAFELRGTLSVVSAKDPQSQMLDYFARVMPEISERYALSRALDAVRIRGWQGERVDFTHRNSCYPQFMFVGAAAVALQDGEVCRRTLRRMGMLDRLSVSTTTLRCNSALLRARHELRGRHDLNWYESQQDR